MRLKSIHQTSTATRRLFHHFFFRGAMHNCTRALINASMIIIFNYPYQLCHFQLSFSFRINFKAKLFRSTFFRSFSLLHFFTEGRGTNNCKCALMKALPLQLSYCWTPNHTLIPKVLFLPGSIHKRIHGHILRDVPFQFGKALPLTGGMILATVSPDWKILDQIPYTEILWLPCPQMHDIVWMKMTDQWPLRQYQVVPKTVSA